MLHAPPGPAVRPGRCLPPGPVLTSARFSDDRRSPLSLASFRMPSVTTPSRIDRVATWVLGVLVFLLPLLHSSVLSDPFALPKKIALIVAALLLWGLQIVSQLREEPRPGIASPALHLSLATLACAAFAVLPAVNRGLALQGLLDLGAGLVLFWAVTRFVREPANAALLLRAVLLSAAIVALGMYLQVLVPGLNLSIAGFSILPPTRAGATLGDAGLGAQFLILALPIGIGAAGLTAGPARLVWGACLGLVGSALVFAGRPEGWIVGGATAGLLLVTRGLQIACGDRRFGRLAPDPSGDSLRAALVALIMLIVTVAAARWPGLPASGGQAAPLSGVTLLSPTTGDPVTDRAAAARGTLAMLRLHPAGVGADNWRHAFLEVAWTRAGKSPFTLSHQAIHAGNDFLERASEFGLLGGLAFALLVLVLVLQAWLAATEAPGPWGTCGYATLNILLVLVVSAFFGAPFEEPVPSALFWIAGGLAQVSLLKASERPGRLAWLRPRPRALPPLGPLRTRRASLVAAAAWIAVAALLGRSIGSRLEASWLTLQGQAALYAARYPVALGRLMSPPARRSPDFLPRALAADAYARLGRDDRAALEFGETLARSPWFVAAYLGRASSYQSAGRYDLADQDLRAALSIWPDNTDTLTALARLDATRGMIDAALDEYRRIEKMNDTLAEPYCRMGDLYLRREQIDEALEAFRLCGTKNPRYPGVQARMGDAFYAKGLLEMALRAYQAAASTDEKNVDVRLKIANTFQALSKSCDAKTALEAARDLETDPGRRSTILELIKKIDPDCARQKKKSGGKG